MLDTVKQLINLKNIDKLIKNKNYEEALTKLNALVQVGVLLDKVYFKRGKLCRQLLMYEDAYSDFTYVITHYEKNFNAYMERMFLNLEMSNFNEAITDAEYVLSINPELYDAYRIKFLSILYLGNVQLSKDYIFEVFNENRFKTIQFILNETAIAIAKDELAKALKLLSVIDLIDQDNPMKILKEATIYGLAGDNEKKEELLNKINSIFPKYFISHFKFGDIYEQRDLLEICFLLELKIFDKRNLFAYPFAILEGYKANLEGHIIDSKECFEKAISINPNKPEAYVLLGETLQLMSGYDNSSYKNNAKENYQKAMEIYEKENLVTKVDAMKRQIKHLNSAIVFEK